MSIFLTALTDGRLVRQQTLATLLTAETVGESGYALGFEVTTRNGRTVFGHSGGSTDGIDTRVFRVLENGDQFILLGNYAPPVTQLLADDLAASLTNTGR